jgi:mono/diheme cytochrome c family protein
MNRPAKNIKLIAMALLLVVLSGVGCYQGQPSKQTPIHVNPSMDDQAKYQPQASSRFFKNDQAMQMPVEGTIARGQLKEDMVYYTGRDLKGQLVKSSPVPFTMEILRRGQDRFNIYCAPCHGRTGAGDGIVVKRGMFPPPTYHQDRLRDIEDGHLFEVISNGIRNMPSYRSQVPVADRWAIVNYVRALQRSQNAKANDVPEEVRKSLQ